ncbi:MAG: SGNH/GDSL hydrolase family protein, partial [Bythopirellula sp.]
MLDQRFGLRDTVACALLLLLFATDGRSETLTLEQDDSVVILGNTFAERLHLYGYLETAMHCRFPDHHLRVRNMGWSADEVDLRIRPKGFPDLLDELRNLEADVILLCFGMNESFGGPDKIDHFRRELGNFVSELQQQRFNGLAAPRIALVSPIAHEPKGGDLPSGVKHNLVLSRYAEAMAETAEQRKVLYLDLFKPTLQWIAERPEQQLTRNGIHLTEYGDWVVSRMMAQRLGWIDEANQLRGNHGESARRLRRAVYEKNYEFFNWWHP